MALIRHFKERRENIFCKQILYNKIFKIAQENEKMNRHNKFGQGIQGECVSWD